MPKRYEVRVTQEALGDLQDLHRYIAAQTSNSVADGYLARLRTTIESLDTFPERGTRRDNLRPGLRIIGFERRVAILFEVFDAEVAIYGVYYGGQDIDARIANDNP